jgi:methionyl-tRNA synthetase
VNIETEALSTFGIILIIILVCWETVWKAIALWKAGRLNHLVWFIFIFILNTAGILPIIYIFAVARKKEKEIVETVAQSNKV